MKKFVLLLIICPFLSFSQAIVQAEYFFDNDPGFGNGTPITVSTPAAFTTINTQISTAGLAEGMHTLNIRTRDNDSLWSLYQTRLVYVKAQPSLPDISYMEYFFNTDPGLGNGIPVNLTFPAPLMNVTDQLSTAGLTNGMNLLYIRARDSNNYWSHSEARLVYVLDTLPKNIVAAEYFIDSVGVFGSGTPLSVTSPAGFVTITDIIATSSLALGNYTIYIRVQDDQGVWSLYEPLEISIATSIDENENRNWLSLYPNPASSNVLLHYNLQKKANVLIEIKDMQGKDVMNFNLQNMNPGIYEQFLDVNQLNNGYYIINLNLDGNLHLSQKLIVNK